MRTTALNARRLQAYQSFGILEVARWLRIIGISKPRLALKRVGNIAAHMPSRTTNSRSGAVLQQIQRPR